MLIGYARPTSIDPSCKEQYNVLKLHKCEKVISETHSSSSGRVELEEMIRSVSTGDIVLVTKLSILADSLPHLVELLLQLEEKGGRLRSIQEEFDSREKLNLTLTEILTHIVEFQSNLISEKTKAGLLEAKQNGVYAGRPRTPDENLKKAIDMYKSKKHTLSEIKKETGISKSTLYRYLGK